MGVDLRKRILDNIPLPEETDKAMNMFGKIEKQLLQYGPNVEDKLISMIKGAMDKGVFEDIILGLENHYRQHMRYQHPDLRNDGCNLLLLERMAYKEAGLEIKLR